MEILTNKTGFVAVDSSSLANPGSDLGVDLVQANWQQQMKWAIRSATELRQRLNLPEFPENSQPEVDSAATQFPVFVPLPFLSRIRPNDLSDPLLRQVLPVAEEVDAPIGFSTDPLGETAATRLPGLLHKYHGRVLLVTTGACAVNCRYCFRRHFPYDESPKSPAQWEFAVAEIAKDLSVEEVILSGGDPLTLVDESLERLVAQLSLVSHLKRIRIHTRLPIMIPQRVTKKLLEIFSGAHRLQTIMVIHSNHANELDGSVQQALQKIAGAGVMLLNQSVLLRGVNDNVDALVMLSERLLACGVLPYYLHKNDPVIGTAHFEVSIAKGIELIQAMRAISPGYAVPRFVQEVAGEPSKTVLA